MSEQRGTAAKLLAEVLEKPTPIHLPNTQFRARILEQILDRINEQYKNLQAILCGDTRTLTASKTKLGRLCTTDHDIIKARIKHLEDKRDRILSEQRQEDQQLQEAFNQFVDVERDDYGAVTNVRRTNRYAVPMTQHQQTNNQELRTSNFHHQPPGVSNQLLPPIQLPLIVPITPQGTPIPFLPFQPNLTFLPPTTIPNPMQDRVPMAPMIQNLHQPSYHHMLHHQQAAQYGGTTPIQGQLYQNLMPSSHHIHARQPIPPPPLGGINPNSSPTLRFPQHPLAAQPYVMAMTNNLVNNTVNHIPKPENPTVLPLPAEQFGKAHPMVQQTLPVANPQHGKSKYKPFYSSRNKHQKLRNPKKKDHQ